MKWLTSVGSVRPSSNFGKGENDNTPYGGYYTKEELKDIVKYCEERYIEVIPEFDFPGHTTAVISAYPELSCTGEKIELIAELSERDREILIDGGLLNFTKNRA